MTNRFTKTSQNVQGGIMRSPSDGDLKLPLVCIQLIMEGEVHFFTIYFASNRSFFHHCACQKKQPFNKIQRMGTYL